MPGSVPDATIVTPSVPRGGVMRVEGTTCGDTISVRAGKGPNPYVDSSFSGTYSLNGNSTPRAFAFGVSVPVSTAAGDYTVSISCADGDAIFPPTFRTVTVTDDQVAPVVTTVTAPASGREGAPVQLDGRGCHSGRITSSQARVLIGSSGGFVMKWDEYVVPVSAGGEFVVDAVLRAVVNPEYFPKWYVATYCVVADGMNYGEASTTIALDPTPPSTTVPPVPLTPRATVVLPQTN